MQVLLAICTTLASAGEQAPSPVRPNVVLILIDNCGQEWFGCYGSDERRTPQIDRLAATGVRFEHCYTFPVCGPSRIELLTGRYPLRTGFVMHHDAALYSGGGLDPGREVLFPRLFREAGYVTGIAGKWQINNLYDEPDILARHGFDEHLAWPGSIDPAKASDEERRQFRTAVENRDSDTLAVLNRNIESRYWDPVLIRNGAREAHQGKFGPDVLQAFALDFLERHRNRPFLLYYPMVLTHGQSFLEPVVPMPLNRGKSLSEHEMFGDMLGYADKQIGEVVSKLDALRLRERTILIVASDNGTESAQTASRNGRPVRGGLYQLTEAGGDVALIVNCPGRIPGGRTAPLTDFTDVFPTLCHLAGIEIPATLVLDGKSQAAVLEGQPGAQSPRQWIFNQYDSRRVVRDHRYKLYSTGELFDVEEDREEQHNLAGSADAQVMAAKSRLAGYLASLPPDVPPPLELRSLSEFKLRPRRPR